jgi:hypothetical protein
MSKLSREQIEEFRRDQWWGPSPLHEVWLEHNALVNGVCDMALASLSDDSVRVPRDLLDRCIERSSSDAPNYEAIQALRKWLAASEREAG